MSDLPSDIEALLRASEGKLNQAAKEAMLVEMYRQGRLTHSQFSQALGLSRDEANGLLKRHQVEEDLLKIEDLREQLKAIGVRVNEQARLPTQGKAMDDLVEQAQELGMGY